MTSPRHATCITTVVTLLASVASLQAADRKDMVGKWRWQSFTIEVVECKGDSLCAKVIAGPKNVGMDLFASGLVARSEEWVGQIVHPETRETYNTRFQKRGKDRWQLDGCTAAQVCLSGEFVRVN